LTRGLAGAAVLVAVIWATALAHAHPHAEREPRAQAAADTTGRSTVEQRIVGTDPRQGFSFLGLGPGEAYVVREELAPARAGRERRRRSLLYLAQLTDFQLSDEESPARVEFLDDAISSVASSAWRPQEAFVAHQTEYTIRQVNRFLSSPVRDGEGERAQLLNAVLTGDLADNAQRNETEWVVRLLEGGTVNPNSGSSNVDADYDPFCRAQVAAGRLDPAEAPRYTGVQDYDDYFESPIFYDPERPRGIYAQRGWPVYPGLMDEGQKPFQAEGLRVPSYVLFGNHDNLVQGNEDAIQPYETVATGCVKPLSPLPGVTRPLENLNPDALQPLATDPTKTVVVPPDPNRRFVDRPQFRELHRTGRQADEHGFSFIDPAELSASAGAASYYSFSPKRGIRYISIDTIADAGNTADQSDGNVDDPQWRWLERELEAASERNELIVAFGHHATGSMDASTPDELAARCTTNDSHGHDVNPGCDRDPRQSTPLHDGADLAALFNQHPRVIAYVAGHSHEARVAPVTREGGGFWEIKSPAVVDWPAQHRLIEVMDNRDGTLSMFGTLLDHDGPATAPASGTSAAGLDPEVLASIGRAISYNDPQAGPGVDGEVGPEGAPTDRNVELLIADPRAGAAQDDQDRGGRGRGRGDRRDRDDSGDGSGAGGTSSGGGSDAGLPFTGFVLAALVALGLVALLAGALLRRLRAPGGAR
jgi:metallophosphoesterase (TIGR03767 family)